MNIKKLAVTLTILCAFCGAAAALGGNNRSNDEYTISPIVYAASATPETTSMLFIPTYTKSHTYIEVTNFGNTRVSWTGIRDPRGEVLERRGVIIPSGNYRIAFTLHHSNGSKVSGSFGYRFRPGRFYYISYDSVAEQFGIRDYTDNADFKSLVTQMQRIILRQNPAAEEIRIGGIQSALDRAVNTLAASIDRSGSVAVMGISAQDSETARFVQEELEARFISGNFTVVDRQILDNLQQGEQQFRASGDVDVDTAVAFGRFAGAGTVVTGTVTGGEGQERLWLLALDTQTSAVLGSASEMF